MTLTVYTNNLVGLGGRYVGRVDRDSYLFTGSGERRGKTRFFTKSSEKMHALEYDVPHEVDAPLYVGGPSEWTVNPDFEAEVRAVLGM